MLSFPPYSFFIHTNYMKLTSACVYIVLLLTLLLLPRGLPEMNKRKYK